MKEAFEIVADARKINLYPKTELEEIIQNIHTLLTTPIGSVPLYRAFGIDTTLVDSPLMVAKARLSSEIFRLIERYEPRVTVTEIAFDMKENMLIPKVKVRLKE